MAKSGSKTDILLGLQGAIAAAQDLGDQKSQADKELRQSIKDILEATITERGANLEEGKFGETKRYNTASIEQAKGDLRERSLSRQQEQFTNRAVTAALLFQKQNPNAPIEDILAAAKQGEPTFRTGVLPPEPPPVRLTIPSQKTGGSFKTAFEKGKKATFATDFGLFAGVPAFMKSFMEDQGVSQEMKLEINRIPEETIPGVTEILKNYNAGNLNAMDVFNDLEKPIAGKKVPPKARLAIWQHLNNLEETTAPNLKKGTPGDLIQAGNAEPPTSGMPSLPPMPSLPQAQRTPSPPPGSASVVAGDLLKNVQPGSVLDQAMSGVPTPLPTPIPRLVGEEKDIWKGKLADLSKAWSAKNAFALQEEIVKAFDDKRLGNEDYTELNVAIGKMRFQQVLLLQEGKGGF